MSVETPAAGFNSLNLAWPQNIDLISEGDDSIRTFKTIVRMTMPNVNGAMNASETELNYSVGLTGLIQGQLNLKAPSLNPTFTGAVILPANTQIGPVNNAEIGYLSGVTGPLQTQINLKAPSLNPTFTGVPLAPTAAPGTGTQQIATTAFVAAAGLSSALPGQAGNAGKFVTTDGASASWAFPTCPVTPFTGTAGALVANTRHPMTNVAASAGTLPAAPPDGTFVGVTPANGLQTNTVLRSGGCTIQGVADDLAVDVAGTLWLFYRSATNDWRF